MEVSHAAPQHSGNYRCTLRNIAGEAYIDYDVEVIGKLKTFIYINFPICIVKVFLLFIM